MKKYIIIAILVLFAGTAFAGQKYNPHTGRWETVPDNYQTQYNPHDNSWSYQPDNAEVVYNPHEGSWDWDSGHNQ